MVDPLGITASVLAVVTATIQSAQFVVTTIDNIKSVPDTVQDVRNELAALDDVLHHLHKLPVLVTQTTTQGLLASPSITRSLKNCEGACKGFGEWLSHTMRHSTEDKTSKIDRSRVALFGLRKIDAFRGHLDSCKVTLQLALTTVTMLSQPTFTPDMKSNKAKQLEEHEKDIERKIAVAKSTEAKIEKEMGKLRIAPNIASDNAEQEQQELSQASNDEEFNEAKRELMSELQHQRSSNQAYCQLSEDALGKTMSQRTGTKVSIKGVTVTEQGVIINGVISETGEELKIQLDISDVTVKDQGIALNVVADKLDLDKIFAARNEAVRLHAGDKATVEGKSKGRVLGTQTTTESAGATVVQSPTEQARANRVRHFSQK
ncbi:hypothetical protein BDW02DRAFT_635403 [Decorospora gaudefroyi]|uniref:Azaphilone pigments biosynthesis cluster protein L N-terminal domain-containing protein n=1 Tax=Decorospora gaudefroyi TaxID=184978 RepID=A0A6A5JXM5_9PLEO|nr:hypothetical protein BDW02DRAFT_635403 [Decorospora gaudefroyi]